MNFIQPIIFILICDGAGFLGSFFTTPSIPTWYANLQKPSFSPPNWLFAPVWTILYALMGIAAYLIWKTGI
jgi:benzodiazapine receptor